MRTRERTCDREAEIRKFIRSKVDDPEIRAHAVGCAACRETLAVATWMQALAGLAIEATPPANPNYLWWKAQVLRRWEVERAAVTPIEVGERVQVGIGLIGAIVLLVWLWRQLQPLATPPSVPPTLIIVMITSGVLLAITAVIAARELTARE